MKIDRIAKQVVSVFGAAALLMSASLALGAGPVSTAAIARTADVLSIERAAGGKLLAIGRLDRISRSDFSVSVLSQDFELIAGKANFAFISRAEIGRAVALFGERVNGKYLVDAAVILDGVYVQGASKVYLRGAVATLDGGVGAFSIGALQLDATSTSFDASVAELRRGSAVAIVGTQPSISDRVLVERVVRVRPSSRIRIDASVGTGRPEASVGTGRREASVGTGRPEASVGTGRPEASVGTGKPDASVGTGRREASVGTG